MVTYTTLVSSYTHCLPVAAAKPVVFSSRLHTLRVNMAIALVQYWWTDVASAWSDSSDDPCSGLMCWRVVRDRVSVSGSLGGQSDLIRVQKAKKVGAILGLEKLGWAQLPIQ